MFSFAWICNYLSLSETFSAMNKVKKNQLFQNSFQVYWLSCECTQMGTNVPKVNNSLPRIPKKKKSEKRRIRIVGTLKKDRWKRTLTQRKFTKHEVIFDVTYGSIATTLQLKFLYYESILGRIEENGAILYSWRIRCKDLFIALIYWRNRTIYSWMFVKFLSRSSGVGSWGSSTAQLIPSRNQFIIIYKRCSRLPNNWVIGVR